MGGFFGTGRQVADQSSNRLVVFKKTGITKGLAHGFT